MGKLNIKGKAGRRFWAEGPDGGLPIGWPIKFERTPDEPKQTIKSSLFLLRREQLLFNQICAAFLDTGAGFWLHPSLGEFRAVQHDGQRGQCRFPGHWKRSETVSAFCFLDVHNGYQ
jgi:hypothetical protein